MCWTISDTASACIKRHVLAGQAEEGRGAGLRALLRRAVTPNTSTPSHGRCGLSKLAAGESYWYWLVKPLEPPYALEKVKFGLNAGFWVIKVQHYRLVNIDKHTNKRSYKLSDEVNTYSLSACVQHLRVKFAIPRSECVLAGAIHKAILEESGVEDRTEGFFPK